MHPNGRSESKVFVERGESVPFSMPSLLFGLDTDAAFKESNDAMNAKRPGQPWPEVVEQDADTVNERLRRRP